MARSSKKATKDLSDLPIGWTTKEELINLLMQDPDAVAAWGRSTRNRSKPRISMDGSAKCWLTNLFVQNGWQLTMCGALLLGRTYKHWTIHNSANASMTGRVIVGMNRLIHGPWHAHNTTITVWDQFLHFELAMFDGDLHRFVDFKAPR